MTTIADYAALKPGTHLSWITSRYNRYGGNDPTPVDVQFIATKGKRVLVYYGLKAHAVDPKHLLLPPERRVTKLYYLP